MANGIDFGTAVGLIKGLGSPDPAVIESAVNGWLDDHPEATTTVQDGSITKAKLDSNLQGTVDDVADLKSQITDIQSGYLVFSTIDGEYVKSNGTIDTNAQYIRTDYISCSGLDTITIIGLQTTTYYGAFYDSSKAFISYITLLAGAETVITVPTTAAYYRISGQKSLGFFNTVKILAPSYFSALQTEYNHAYLYSLLKQLTNDQEWMIGKYVDYQTGEWGTAASWNAIEIEPSCGYMTTNANGNSAGGIVFLNSSNVVLASYHNMGENPITYAVPSGTAKIRICYDTRPAADTDVFVVGGKVTFDGSTLKAMQDNITPNPKKFAVIGDSISSDNATGKVPCNYLAWPSMLLERWKNNVTYQNLTYPGKRWHDGLISDCASVDSDTDLVVCALGINDALQGYTLGDVDTIMALDLADVTTDTLMGIYRKGLETLKNRLNNESIIVCVAPVTNQQIDNWETNYVNESQHNAWIALNALRQAIKAFVIAEGGPANGWFFIDGREIFEVSETAQNLYYGFKANGDADPTHPNIMGQSIIASKIYDSIPPIGAIKASNYITA